MRFEVDGVATSFELALTASEVPAPFVLRASGPANVSKIL